MNEQYRTCPECGKQHTRDMFLPVSNSSLYGIDGTSYTCIECIAGKINRKDLGSIDKTLICRVPAELQWHPRLL